MLIAVFLMSVSKPRSNQGLFSVVIVVAANLLIASRGGASPQNFEKRVLTIFRLNREPGPYAIRASTGL